MSLVLCLPLSSVVNLDGLMLVPLYPLFVSRGDREPTPCDDLLFALKTPAGSLVGVGTVSETPTLGLLD